MNERGRKMTTITHRPELLPEEKKLSMAKYYDLPLNPPGPLQQQILDAGPMDPKLAIRAQDWLDLLKPSGYNAVEYGCCMLEDGSGYIAMYSVYPNNCEPRMLAWWFHWLNVPPSSQPLGPTGLDNIKYKIWCPPDHIGHGFVNGRDKWGGIWTVESLDLGQGDEKVYTVRHPVDLKEYGLTEAKDKELKDAGCWVDSAYETFHTVDPQHRHLPGTHLMLTLSRPCPIGGMEKITREWIGYGLQDGKPWRDMSTPADMLCEAYLHKVMVHATVEAQQLSKFLPELYAEHKDKPDDAD
jgi:hypothetical protein